jgi:hypothetical protein
LSAFGDPVNFLFPITGDVTARQALVTFVDDRGYDRASRLIVKGRIDKLARRQGVPPALYYLPGEDEVRFDGSPEEAESAARGMSVLDRGERVLGGGDNG